MSQYIEMKTAFDVHETYMKWLIEDWDKVHSRTGGISSDNFVLEGMDATVSFTFNLDVNDVDRLEPVLHVYIEYHEPFLFPNVIAYVCKVNNEKAAMIPVEKQDDETSCTRMFLLPEYDNIQELYIRNNSLTIYCSIKYYKHIHETNESIGPLPSEFVIRNPEENVTENETDFMKLYDYTDNQDWYVPRDSSYDTKHSFTDYAKFFQESKLCDITFVFESEEVKAHKIVLAAASPYFCQKFVKEAAHEIKDYRIDCTDNKNLSPSILRGFFEYIYGIKTVKDLQSIVRNLYVLAEEYKMEKLKETCEAYTREFVYA